MLPLNLFYKLFRFDTLAARALLRLQDELVEYEDQLQSLDEELAGIDAPAQHNGSFREEHSEDRLELIKTIDARLRAYYELALQHSELREKPMVRKMDIRSVETWLENHW